MAYDVAAVAAAVKAAAERLFSASIAVGGEGRPGGGGGVVGEIAQACASFQTLTNPHGALPQQISAKTQAILDKAHQLCADLAGVAFDMENYAHALKEM